MDVGFAGSLSDQKHPDAVMFATPEGSGEQHEALLPETVHERGVVARNGLIEGALSVVQFGPASRVTANRFNVCSLLIIRFKVRESYTANADRPETAAEYRQQLEYLDGEPEWIDVSYTDYVGKPLAEGDTAT